MLGVPSTVDFIHGMRYELEVDNDFKSRFFEAKVSVKLGWAVHWLHGAALHMNRNSFTHEGEASCSNVPVITCLFKAIFSGFYY